MHFAVCTPFSFFPKQQQQQQQQQQKAWWPGHF